MKWKALVLGGGGPVGEFQIGAIQVIANYYDSFDLYVGVGCGSLNSAVLAQHASVKEGSADLTTIWNDIRRTKDIFTVPFVGGELAALAALISESGWARDSIYGSKQLTKQIKRNIDWDILKGKTNWATEITSLNDGQRYTVTNDGKLLYGDINPNRTLQFSLEPGNEFFIGSKIYELLTAGGCTPLMLPPVDLFGHRFAEGGIRNCTPFPLAVKAYEIARSRGYDEAEFIVVDNYVNEPNFEIYNQLDSGLEIIGRTIKLMTIEIAQNEMFLGKTQLDKMGATNAKVTMIQPTVDYRLSPFNFNDLVTRGKIRDHGITRAILMLGHTKGKMVAGGRDEFSEPTIEVLLKRLADDPENVEVSDKIVESLLQGSGGGEELFGQAKASIADVLAFEKRPLPPDTKHPGNLRELVDMMAGAFTNKKKIKAIGKGFAFDDVFETSGVGIQLDKLNNIWAPEPAALKDAASLNSLIEFEAGTTIDELNEYLWSRDKALLNQPGYGELTFAGVSSCGGHGSGIKIGPLAEAIRGINLITFNEEGRVVQKRIEPTIGISDPIKFKQLYPSIELIQDDVSFNACKVSVGLLGIIYSLVVETQAAFYLEETRVLQQWSALKQVLPDKLADSTIHSIHIWFNPYPLKGEINCVLSEYRRVKCRRNRGKRGFGVTFGLVPQLAPLILWCMENFHQGLAAIMTSTLKATVNKYPFVMPCTEALNFGTPNLVSVDATNCGIPAEKTIEVAEKLFEFAAKRYQMGKYITSPVGFRFTAETSAIFSPQYGRPTCMIEMPFIKPTPFAQETIDAFLNLLYDGYQGRPHWGQEFHQTVTLARLELMYPQLSLFKELLKKFNYNGVFNNEFTDKIGLS